MSDFFPESNRSTWSDIPIGGLITARSYQYPFDVIASAAQLGDVSTN